MFQRFLLGLNRNGMISTKMIQTWIKTLVLVTTLLTAVCARADVPVPILKSHVTDLTTTLSIHETTRLEQKLTAFEKTKGSQVAVLIVPTTQPEAIEQYSIHVAEAWKLGRKGIDDGVLLLIAKNDKALRIEVGYGLEGVLPDAMAKRIIEEIIVPKFKEGNFVHGIDAGVEAILGLIEGEPLPPAQAIRGTSDSVSMDSFIPILIGFIVLGKMLQTLLGRFVGATMTSIGVGFIGWLFFSSVVTAILIAIFVFLMSLFQNTGRGIYRNGRGSWPNSGGTGSGGFGGGGGGFGGGGASGRW